MVITAVSVRKNTTNNDKLVGIASVTFNNMIVMHDMKIIKSGEKLMLLMPRKKLKTGYYCDIFHPLNRNFSEALERIVFHCYSVVIKRNSNKIEFLCINDNVDSVIKQVPQDFMQSEGSDFLE